MYIRAGATTRRSLYCRGSRERERVCPTHVRACNIRVFVCPCIYAPVCLCLVKRNSIYFVNCVYTHSVVIYIYIGNMSMAAVFALSCCGLVGLLPAGAQAALDPNPDIELKTVSAAY